MRRARSAVVAAFRLISAGLPPPLEVALDQLPVGSCTRECATCDIHAGLPVVERCLEAQLLAEPVVDVATPTQHELVGAVDAGGSRARRDEQVARSDRRRHCIARGRRASTCRFEARLRVASISDRRGELGALAAFVAFACIA